MTTKDKTDKSIRIYGANQNNLRNINVSFEAGKLTVVTGVSGSGKSSLVFDTLYAEGQRRYVETFSPYVRQFLDRMDRPNVKKIDGIPPAIAIDQTNPVRTSRSTVGTMTEINDHLKLLFAQAARLYCRRCGQEVTKDNPESIWQKVSNHCGKLPADTRLFVLFTVEVPKKFPADDAVQALNAEGFTRVSVSKNAKTGDHILEVIADRFKSSVDKARAIDAIEQSLLKGKGCMSVRAEDREGNVIAHWHFSEKLTCADCGIHYSAPHQSTFSFNSPLGACETCRGFGRVIGVDYDLVVPDRSKSLSEGAVKPWTTDAYAECQDDLLKYAKKAGIATDVPFDELPEEDQKWVFEGDPKWTSWRSKSWYGVKHFFDWLETKAYKMHVRVLLSRYRSYNECPTCGGTRLKAEALLWRIGTREDADRIMSERSNAKAVLPGFNIHELMTLPIEKLKVFFDHLTLTAEQAEACKMLLDEIRCRLNFLNEVGLGYLTLDRQSRTLSGGEVQRINLTTALGTSLVNTLFVLDEPSIGLHPQEIDRINSVMHRLRSSGNTLVVVEHDPQVMLAADRILDMGPGPGTRGGRLVFDGTPAGLRKANTLTGQYLRGTLRIPKSKQRKITLKTPALVLFGAKEHNLKDLDIRIPLRSLVCIAGVSGSGKSTLVQDILIPALMKKKGKPTDAPGQYDEIKGAELINDVVFVDQSPIGKTTRSNPAVFVGAFDAFRKIFAAAPLSRARGYTPGTFSFNSGTGRCPSCEGSGFEHIEMQFLSDVYLSCPDCNGLRYRPETLEVTVERDGRKFNIADVLNLTVREALELFGGNKEILRTLTPLQKVGLDYLKLGQPVPTLSGGEAQRLKLAKHLAEAKSSASPNNLFVFDEPTSGLHFDDIAKLMRSLNELVEAGHSVILVEHNLDVINAADWIIELGPEGGEKGGYELFAGTADTLSIKETPTGLALASYRKALANNNPSAYFTLPHDKNAGKPSAGQLEAQKDNAIVVVNAREHNLKNLSLEIPRDKFTVITGVSGSGKSTLAFDLVFNEGQRRYLESLNAYARSMVQPASRPDVDAIYGIPPTVAIEQRTSRGGQKSTVATLTEIYHFLRLLYVKLGVQYCPDCRIPVEPLSFDSILARVMTEFKGRQITFVAPLIKNRKGIYKDLAAWAHSKGFPELIVDNRIVPTRPFTALARFREHTIGLPIATIAVEPENEAKIKHALGDALEHGKGVVEAWEGTVAVESFSTERGCPECGRSFPELSPRLFSYNSKLGWCDSCMGNGIQLFKDAIDQDNQIGEVREDKIEMKVVCPSCSGARLNPIARGVRFQDKSIDEIAAMTIDEAEAFFKGIKLNDRDSLIAKDPIAEILARLSFLREVGLTYLNLDRSAPTLSGGEAQRIRLASQLGTNLQGVCYVLDEPTIGLHPRDNRILLKALEQLTSNGNSLLVVEHDEDTIERADHVIDIGPGAGARGGQLIAQGTIEEIMNNENSLTGRYLKHPLKHTGKAKIKTGDEDPVIEIVNADEHNLAVESAKFPLNRLIVVTGVSGSGKSTLARSVLLRNLQEAVQKQGDVRFVGCEALSGWEQVDRVLEVDQTPVGKTPRSCPATYVGFWDAIRKLFAETNEAKERGYNASRFSFNVKGGRCDACEGQGVKTLEMNFLPDVKVTCDVCGSMRFNEETLHVQWKGKSIGDVLKMEVDEAVEFFANQSSILHPLKLMQDVGLGYLTLGQPSPTLSGGEAQRIKLVSELTKVRDDLTKRGRKSPHTFYVLDEPTVGLHMADVDKLIKVLQRLSAAGNTVVVIEHNLDVIAEADWIIDMGPEGGSEGGKVIFQGPPEKFVRRKTHTSVALKEFLARSKERNAK